MRKKSLVKNIYIFLSPESSKTTCIPTLYFSNERFLDLCWASIVNSVPLKVAWLCMVKCNFLFMVCPPLIFEIIQGNTKKKKKNTSNIPCLFFENKIQEKKTCTNSYILPSSLPCRPVTFQTIKLPWTRKYKQKNI